VPRILLNGLGFAVLFGCIAQFVSCSTDPLPSSEVAAIDTKDAGEVASPQATDAEVLKAAQVSLQAQGIERLRWGLIPYVAPEEIVARYSPIIDRVSDRLGIPIDIVVGEDYEGLEDLIVDGAVDVAVLGPYAYVRARKREPDLEVFASHVALGSTTYGTYILTHQDSGLEQVDDLVGQSVGFVDRRSTSGWLSPAAHLLLKGINPVSDINAQYLGSHERVFDAVASGQVAAGAVYGASLSEGRRRNPKGGQVIVLAKCARIPYDAYVIRKGVDKAVGDALALALREISTRDRAGRRTLASLARINGFIPVQDDHYNTIRRLENRILDALGPSALAPAIQTTQPRLPEAPSQD